MLILYIISDVMLLNMKMIKNLSTQLYKNIAKFMYMQKYSINERFYRHKNINLKTIFKNFIKKIINF